VIWKRVIFSRKHLSVEALHGLSTERRQFHNHFIEDTTCRPDITTVIVRHVFPDFRAGVVWSSCLGSHHAALCNAGNVHVAEFHDTFPREEHVRALYVSVTDLKIMKSLQAPDNLDEKMPDLLFGEICVFLFMVVNHLEKVTAVCVFHDNTEAHVLEKGLFVTNYVRVIN